MAMAMKLIEVIVRQECDTVVLMTGDTDLIPAIKTGNSLLPRTKIGVAFPLLRHNNSLQEAADYTASRTFSGLSSHPRSSSRTGPG